MAITQAHSRMVSDLDAGSTCTVTINGNGGNQTMGGVGATTLTITEIAA